MALFGFISFALVPFLKYPPNPPSVGNPATIESRTTLFFGMIGLSLAALVIALFIARRLANRLGSWNATLSAAAVFLVLVLLAQWLLPDVNEVPDQFSAVLLWRFRMASFGIQAILWTSLGVLFGSFAQRQMEDQSNAFRIS